MCCLYASYLGKEIKMSLFRYFYTIHFKSKVPFREVFEMKSELTALNLRRNQLAEENPINECSEVDLSQMEGNKAVRYFRAL